MLALENDVMGEALFDLQVLMHFFAIREFHISNELNQIVSFDIKHKHLLRMVVRKGKRGGDIV